MYVLYICILSLATFHQYYHIVDSWSFHILTFYTKCIIFILNRLGPIVVDIVSTKHHDEIHVIYVATMEGELRKLVTIPNSPESCLVERLQIFPKGKEKKIKTMKLLKDTVWSIVLEVMCEISYSWLNSFLWKFCVLLNVC